MPVWVSTPGDPIGAIQLPSTWRTYCWPEKPRLMVTVLATICWRHQSAASVAKTSWLRLARLVSAKMSCMARNATRVPAAAIGLVAPSASWPEPELVIRTSQLWFQPPWIGPVHGPKALQPVGAAL